MRLQHRVFQVGLNKECSVLLHFSQYLVYVTFSHTHTHTRMKLESLVLFCSPVFHQSHGIEVNVTDKDGKLCLYANLMVNFTVLYEAAGNKVSVSSVITRAAPTTLWK